MKNNYKKKHKITEKKIIELIRYNNSYLQKIKIPNYSSRINVNKWETLKHNGVMFHETYIQHNIPFKYNNKELLLNFESEEFITYYVNSKFDKYKNKKFKKNFFKDWKLLLSEELKIIITDFELCDFSKIKNFVDQEQMKNKNKNLKEKEIISKKKKEEYDKYRYITIDSKQQVIDNFIVEPPTIFIGRGKHPLSGCIKKRINPEDVTLNIDYDTEVPKPNVDDKKKHSWKGIISDKTLEWIASWYNNVTKKYNYARFGKKSKFKMLSDEKKYDLARKLKKKINKVRFINENNLNSNNKELVQLSTALYLIDKLALRIGNEKRDDQSETAGVTTLKIKNIHLLKNNTIKLDFLGKDSIRYINKINVPVIIYKNIQKNYNRKNKNEYLFDLITSDSINKYIKKFMRKLTSKVFRTYNTSLLMKKELEKIIVLSKKKKININQIIYLFNLSLLKAAKLCNHQKVISNKSEKKIEKINKHIDEIKKKINLNKKNKKLKEKLKLLKNKKKILLISKNLSTITSKVNYIDPRIIINFLRKMEIIEFIDKFFNKSQQEQFKWALKTKNNFRW